MTIVSVRHTLRRSCAACAKSKHRCDLSTPTCSRCVKRKVLCVYANEPLTATPAVVRKSTIAMGRSFERSGTFSSVDPFDSYPQTRLPRAQVQRLIHSFLHKIAFEYYPLDLNAASNPFLISWWPLALGDPALFHVCLQTACLDEEMRVCKGFNVTELLMDNSADLLRRIAETQSTKGLHSSELLMADSVALLRHKVSDATLAVQDGTLNSIITLASIEFGKGNLKVAQMHVDAVRRLVNMRGGLNSVRQTSPLTARMITWVSMIVVGRPVFQTRDDFGLGEGIPPIPEWQIDVTAFHHDLSELNIPEIDFVVANILVRLRNVFKRAEKMPFSTTSLHDLTSFVVHRLMLSAPNPEDSLASPLTESIRLALILYMFIMHGATYYPHAVISDKLAAELMEILKKADTLPHQYCSLDVWIVATGLVSSAGTSCYQFFVDRAQAVSNSLSLENWDDALVHIRNVLWLEALEAEATFRPHWHYSMAPGTKPPMRICRSPRTTFTGYICMRPGLIESSP
ncbi:hypothetical protein QBC35DRAFT_470641 [Podospora australis]|uniref:Zn(2)-C6 fungal-type domain-containing protein n=1 Tax=Podospora australis TaxID=1536484 RepID=A0AAN6X060_9PEZI|nr:hypothetical protein QBC35DRAFT_470641 [Podospora australis]